ncbi:MAG: glycerol kinase GlpK [Oscillospiraceae bacterium]|jgi:glycerol kinase|nr:glycerol kinase GlpK [Oscillospiraceae bacterium]
MSRDYILALDQGTTSSRAIVFSREGKIVAKSQREFPQIYPQPGWVEHDPIEILDSQLAALRGVFASGKVRPSQIAAIGVTNQRETTVLWDKRTGQPVYNAIVWQCRRTAKMCEELKSQGHEELIRAKTGLLIDAYFSGTKIRWILDNVPEARRLSESGNLLFGTIETWLIWNLTGGEHVTDYSNASRTMLFDVDKLRWDDELCRLLGVPQSILPKPVPSSKVYGTFKSGVLGLADLAGVPISGAIGDQPGALFGQACFQPGEAKNTYGTGCFLLMHTGTERVQSRNQLLTGVAWGLGDTVEYAIEGSAFNGGATIQWLRDELHLIASAPECDTLAESVPDANGAYCVPAFTGLGAPYWDMYARGAIVGLTRGVNRAHIARAVLEGIAFQVKDLLEAMQADSGIPLRELRVDGGASVSNIMMQIQADLLDCRVNRPTMVETTAWGAACMAGLAVGVWHNREELLKLRQVARVFDPKMDEPVRAVAYAGWKKAVGRAKGWAEQG